MWDRFQRCSWSLIKYTKLLNREWTGAFLALWCFYRNLEAVLSITFRRLRGTLKVSPAAGVEGKLDPECSSKFCIPAVISWLPSNLLFAAAALLRLPQLTFWDFLHSPECNLLRVWSWWVMHYVTAGDGAETVKKNESHYPRSDPSMPRGCSVLLCQSCCGWRKLCLFLA